jgi:membrane fusion protein (multidrug efflux system)
MFEEWIGTMDGSVNAQIRAQVTGYVVRQDYAEGSQVTKGDLLFEIDARPFQAVLSQAEAKLAQDRALMAKTDLDVKRFAPLAQEQAISQETLDDAMHANLAAKAQVQADEAAMESARLNLSFTRISSPIDGLAGIALAQIGDLVSPSGPVLTTVSTINPIKVYFQVSEDSYLNFWQSFAASRDTNQVLKLKLVLSNGAAYPEAGKFFSADRQVNPTTGTLQIVGLFPNPNSTLRPGQYGRVRVQTETRTNVIVVPQRAVAESQGNYHVIVVGSENKAHLQSVKVGSQVGPLWVINEGLKAGDQVIVEGTLKAKEGALVKPTPYAVQASDGATISSAP